METQPLVVVAGVAGGQESGQRDPQVEQLAEWLTGSFSSQRQAEADTSSEFSYTLTDYALEVAENGENTLAVLSQHAKRWGKVKNGRSSANHIFFMLDAGKNK